MTFRPELGISNFQNYDAIAAEHGLKLYIFNDLSAITLNEYNNISTGDSRTVTQNEDEIITDISVGSTGTHNVELFWAIPGGASAITLGACYTSAFNASFSSYTFRPDASAQTAGTHDRIQWNDSSALQKVINGAASNIDTALLVQTNGWNAMLNRKTATSLMALYNEYGRIVQKTSEVSYPADADLNTLSYWGITTLRTGNPSTCRRIIAAPIITGRD